MSNAAFAHDVWVLRLRASEREGAHRLEEERLLPGLGVRALP